jgi:short subunit dehydrogenase-like uncharacterized protein
MPSKREFAVVVHGATGFTGRLVSQYMSEAKSAAHVDWAICGRREEKLEELAAECGKKGRKPQIIVADADSKATIEEMCKRTQVVIACAGPFTKLGMPVAEACVKTGTHYVDITGEFNYGRKLVEELHDSAVKKGVVLLPFSGFDSVPSDLSNAYAFELAQEAGTDIRHVANAFRIKGGMAPSRGTIESILLIFENLEKQDRSPMSLIPSDRRPKVATPSAKFPSFNRALVSFTGPFFMEAINARVVRRANVLSSNDNRRLASYEEFSRGGVVEVVMAFLVSVVFLILTKVPGAVNFMRKHLFPSEGEGPTEKKNSRWTVDTLGYKKHGDATPVVRGRVSSDLDGYRFTAMSASEAALALVNNELDEGVHGGVLSTGCALTQALPRRLKETGRVKFEPVRVGKQ